jgi:RND family efflux transporter MFP subunit
MTATSFTRYFIQFLFILSFVLIGCSKKPGDDEESQPSIPAIVAVRTASVSQGNIDVVVTASGKTEAFRNVKVFSPIAGRILSLKVLEGAQVKSGDVLATILTKESYAAIAGAEALLQSAQSEVAKEEARRAAALARSTQSTVSVRAKTSGVVATRNVSEGELVYENVELMTLVDLSTIVFTADVMLRDLPSVRIGQNAVVQFQSLPNHEFRATVDAINPQTDVQSQTVKVRIRFNGLRAVGNHLITDMAGTARIVTATHKDVCLVPTSALLRNDETNTFSIIVVSDDSLARSIPVDVGASTDSVVEVKSAGLEKGTSVIIEGNYAIADSTKVTVVN